MSRGKYAAAGLTLFALKHNIDRIIATAVFGRSWSVFNYLAPGGTVESLSAPDMKFYGTLLAVSLPFIWIGVVLSLRRLRAAGLPAWLVAFFFLPVVNLVFFLVLSLIPAREDHRSSAREGGLLDRIIPDHTWGSAAVGVLLSVLLAIGSVAFGVTVLRQYGWGLFVGLPFCMGLASVLVYGYHRRRDLASCLVVSLFSVVIAGAGLMAVAIEGIFCLAMAAPLALVLASLGGWIGYLIQRHSQPKLAAPQVLMALLVAAPALMAAEYAAKDAPPLFEVRTAVDINAPPEVVWRHVVSFAELPEAREWIFRIGIAYPMRAEIQGQGPGAVRHCVFSTGSFVEPIQVWDEPRLLQFSVTAQPPAMREWTPYPGVSPPHLDDYLVSQGGRFLLVPLPNGRTRLVGTTWYRNKMWPADYWQTWSDWIIHRIHRRVLQHIQGLAERVPDIHARGRHKDATPAAGRRTELRVRKERGEL